MARLEQAPGQITLTAHITEAFTFITLEPNKDGSHKALVELMRSVHTAPHSRAFMVEVCVWYC